MSRAPDRARVDADWRAVLGVKLVALTPIEAESETKTAAA